MSDVNRTSPSKSPLQDYFANFCADESDVFMGPQEPEPSSLTAAMHVESDDEDVPLRMVRARDSMERFYSAADTAREELPVRWTPTSPDFSPIIASTPQHHYADNSAALSPPCVSTPPAASYSAVFSPVAASPPPPEYRHLMTGSSSSPFYMPTP